MARRRFSETELNALFGKSRPTEPLSALPLPVKPAATPPPSLSPPPAASSSSTNESGVVEISVGQITPNPHQPRMHFDEAKLQEMADSIRVHGVLQPILVRRVRDGYQLVAGERRLRGAQRAGLSTIPALVISLSEEELLEVALIENLQRDDLNAIEEARAFESLTRQFGMNHEEIAKRVGKDRTTVVNSLRLLRLPPEIQSDLLSRRLSPGHARALLSLDGEDQMLQVRAEILESGLSVRQTEERVRDLMGQKKMTRRRGTPSDKEISPEVADLETRLTESIGTRVRLRPTSAVSGRIEITYTNLDELDRICAKLGIDQSVTEG